MRIRQQHLVGAVPLNELNRSCDWSNPDTQPLYTYTEKREREKTKIDRGREREIAHAHTHSRITLILKLALADTFLSLTETHSADLDTSTEHTLRCDHTIHRQCGSWVSVYYTPVWLFVWRRVTHVTEPFTIRIPYYNIHVHSHSM